MSDQQPHGPQLLCTLGPASLRADIIGRLSASGVDLFRINLAHTAVRSLAATVDLVRANSTSRVCLDLEGAQVRCGMLSAGTSLLPADMVRFTPEPKLGNAQEISLRPPAVFAALGPGATLRLGSDRALARVGRVDERGVTAIVVEGGRVASNASVTVDPSPLLPALSGKDRRAIEIGRDLGVDCYGLPFAASAAGVEELRAAAPDAGIIAKIESWAGVWNRDEIIGVADAVLIDRADLSRQVRLEEIPYFQKAVVEAAVRRDVPVFVAANLPDFTSEGLLGTVAEASDIAGILLAGAAGIALAGETAVGPDPVGVVERVRRCLTAFERSAEPVASGEEAWGLALLSPC